MTGAPSASDFITQLALKNRLLAALLLLISGGFVASAIGFAQGERQLYADEIHGELGMMARLLEANVAAPMLYGAEAVATELLTATLKENPGVVQAVLYSSDKTPFSIYHRGTEPVPPPPPFRLEGQSQQRDFLEQYWPLHFEDQVQPLGALYIQYDLRPLNAHMTHYYLLQGGMLLGILALTWLFGRRLQAAIVRPYERHRQRLAAQVGERTAQLREANERLQEEVEERRVIEADLLAQREAQAALIKKLEQAQNQLLQSEKMASIGQLAAGVAHEINNPVGFINSNLNTLGIYVASLLRLLEAYEQALPTAQDPALSAAIQALREAEDIDYLREDIGDLLAESRDGVDRVRKIVQDLKDFSHSNVKQTRGWEDLQRGLESTLNVAWNEIKYKAEVVRDYQELPPVYCCLSQINQVFMNLLVNAAHAIEGKGTITLRLGCRGDWAWVEVSDTGSGIAPGVLERIFDPFFTTKPVGKGTGLGLSLAYGIVKDHGGEIRVQSSLGQGSRFCVWLPIQGTDNLSLSPPPLGETV